MMLVLVVKWVRKNTIILFYCNVWKKTIILSYCIINSRGWLTFILFVARGIISGVFQAAYVYTPEVSGRQLILNFALKK